MTLTAITYNCNPDSLVDVTPEAFVDAFEARIYSFPHYRELAITVTFDAKPSGLTSITTDAGDDAEDYAGLDDPAIRDEFRDHAEHAFKACL